MDKGIKSWAKEDRPREKMIEKGVWALSNAELIAILLSSGNKKESAVDLARHILNDCDQQLKKLSAHTVKSLSKYQGIGPAKAVTLLAALELSNRRMSETKEGKIISQSKDAYTIMYQHIANRSYEELWAIFLDSGNRVISSKKISDGGIAFTSCDPKKIIKMALDELAVSIILCHNHPSGNITPSSQDRELTKKMSAVCQLMGIKLFDHIIIGDEQYYSFCDNNEL